MTGSLPFSQSALKTMKGFHIVDIVSEPLLRALHHNITTAATTLQIHTLPEANKISNKRPTDKHVDL